MGQSWPKGDEDRLTEVGHAWNHAARQLIAVHHAMTPATQGILDSIGGQVATEYEQFTRQLTTLLPNLAQSADGLSELAHDTAVQLEYAKYMLLVQLIWLAWALTELALFGVPEAGAALVTGVAAVCRQILATLLRSIVTGAAFMVGADVAIQTIQFLKGDRTHWDLANTLQALEGGAIGGAFGGVLIEAGRLLAPKIAHTLLGQLTTGATTGLATTLTTDAINGGDLSTDAGLAAASGAISGLHGGRTPKNTHHDTHTTPHTNLPTPIELDNLTRDFTPPLETATPEQTRNGQWLRGQWDTGNRHDAERNGAAPELNRVYGEWSRDNGGLPIGLRERVLRQVASDLRVSPVEGTSAAGQPTAIRRSLDRQAAVEGVVERVQHRFDAGFTSWAHQLSSPQGESADAFSPHTPTSSAAGEHLVTGAGAAVRVHRTAWEAVDAQVRAEIQRLPAKAFDGPSERLLRQADLVLERSAPGLHRLLDQAVQDDVRHSQALYAYERSAPAPGHGVGHEGVLSPTGRDLLRQEWQARISADHQEIFGPLTATGRHAGAHDTVAGSDGPGSRHDGAAHPTGPNPAAPAPADQRSGAPEPARTGALWQERVQQRLAELPDRVGLQLAKESAVRHAVLTVQDATRGSWRGALDGLGPDFARTF